MNVIEIAFGIICGLLSVISTILWFDFREVRNEARRANTDLAALRESAAREVSTLREQVAREYLTRTQFIELKSDMDKKFDAVFTGMGDIRKDIQGMSDAFRDRLEDLARETLGAGERRHVHPRP